MILGPWKVAEPDFVDWDKERIETLNDQPVRAFWCPFCLIVFKVDGTGKVVETIEPAIPDRK